MENITTSNFSRLIGNWKTSGIILTDGGILSGEDHYEFVLDGAFILHRANVIMGKDTSQTFEMISLDNFPSRAKNAVFQLQGRKRDNDRAPKWS